MAGKPSLPPDFDGIPRQLDLAGALGRVRVDMVAIRQASDGEVEPEAPPSYLDGG